MCEKNFNNIFPGQMLNKGRNSLDVSKVKFVRFACCHIDGSMQGCHTDVELYVKNFVFLFVNFRCFGEW